MTATATATEFAAELGDRIKHEAQKLHALEAVTRPLRKPEPKKKSKLGMVTMLVVGVGVMFALYRKLRPTAAPETFERREPTPASTNGSEQPEPQRLATAGL
jgi:hypothetical protein